ncbi:FtsK/SpoIIIE domain-containing protein [Bacteriovoracaceae bacterium]|nr:FtsK/SpoIIIE domain-containing protein [Bacteriovoracaceae bacterium]
MSDSKSPQPSNFDKEMAKVFDQAAIAIGIICAFNFKILCQGLKEVGTLGRFLKWLIPITLISYMVVRYQWQLDFLYWLSPKFFHNERLEAIFYLGTLKNVSGVAGISTLVWLWICGIIPTIRLRGYQNALDCLGLKNAKDFAPKVVDATRLDTYRVSLKVLAPGIGVEKIKARRDELQSSFEKDIEEINRFKNPKYVEIILSTKFLPDFVDFSQALENLTESGSFIVGESKKEFVTCEIAKLPHMMIAGTTGGGKSQFFKQLLTGLLKSTDHLQMHLIDMKGGLEFRDFATLPNVKVAKTIEASVSTLRKVKKEMDARFDYLEEKGVQQIEPERHPFDRIVIGVDEASVLYAQARRDDEDYDLICEARNLTEKIAKLGRAAAINLVLATQKVSKESIDTRIQENITGRMCFKTGTPEGSVRVLGNAKASHLPATPGRGVWQFGNEECEVQAPYLSTNAMKEVLQEVKEEYQTGAKTVKQKNKEVDTPMTTSAPVTTKPLTKEMLLNDTQS